MLGTLTKTLMLWEASPAHLSKINLYTTGKTFKKYSRHLIIMLKELNQFLYQNMPATKAMKIRLLEFENNQLKTSAPLEPNINDKGTFFGGSGSSLMIISAWSLIELLCKSSKIEADVVIFSNQAKWLKPLKDSANIFSELSSEWKPQTIIQRLKKNKSTPLECRINLFSEQSIKCVEMTAKYFIIPQSRS